MDQGVILKNRRIVEITPNWANKIKALAEVGFPFPLSLQWWKWYFELDSPSKCIVGEAHGYTSQYERECKTCDRIGWEFGHSFLIRSKKEFEDNVEEFVTHWNEKHSS
ncbi:MAG TPA: hypothetical protein VH481_00225 [Nitrososphaeraceae archaeon]|jgi:hypothetical protein